MISLQIKVTKVNSNFGEGAATKYTEFLLKHVKYRIYLIPS